MNETSKKRKPTNHLQKIYIDRLMLLPYSRPLEIYELLFLCFDVRFDVFTSLSYQRHVNLIEFDLFLQNKSTCSHSIQKVFIFVPGFLLQSIVFAIR